VKPVPEITTVSCFYSHFAETGERRAECVPEQGDERRYLDRKGRKGQKNGEDCMMMSFVICNRAKYTGIQE
jgi:hypothetical protein